MNAGEIDVKRAGFGSMLEQREAVHKDGWNVVTSQRRDVGSTIYRSQQTSTSRCPNVAMSARVLSLIIKSKRGVQNSRQRG